MQKRSDRQGRFKTVDMRRFIVLASCLLLVPAMAGGQSFPEPFFPSAGAGTVLVYEIRNADGMTQVLKSDSVAVFSGDFTHGQATVISSLFSGDSLYVRNEVPVVFDRGEVIIDMVSLMEKAMQDGMKEAMNETVGGEEDEELKSMKKVLEKMTVKGECRGIPADMEVGMELPDYWIEVKVMFFSPKMEYRDRRVTGRETVTTPAGTFDCFVVEETMTSKAMMSTEKTRQVSWYARGVGLVKQQTWEKKQLTGTTLLTAVR